MKKYFYLLLLSLVGISLQTCKHDFAGSTDLELLEFINNSSNYVWYKFSDQLILSGSGSGHTESLLRTKYSPLASTVLDQNGKVIADTSFPVGSVIIKELHSSPTTLSTYAVMYKQPGHKDADIYGWVWGYLYKDGSVREPASNKGKACNGCHNGQGSIDFTLMNREHP